MRYNELQLAVQGIANLMHPIIERKPNQKEVEAMKRWNEEIQPYRVECIRLQYELISELQNSY